MQDCRQQVEAASRTSARRPDAAMLSRLKGGWQRLGRRRLWMR
jgi:hypothetical protein